MQYFHTRNIGSSSNVFLSISPIQKVLEFGASRWTITFLPKDAKLLDLKREQKIIFDAPFICNDEFLYAAVDVKDDILILEPGRDPWHQDGVEVRVNAMPDPGRSESSGFDEFKDTLLIALSPGETPDQMVFHRKSDIPSGVQAVCVKTNSGHNTEIAIPFSYLDEKQGGAWKIVRFNVCVDDVDETTDWGLSQLWWRPDWRTPLTYTGSGAFSRP